jgi:WhiB family redox-sensing transcriptional regulator
MMDWNNDWAVHAACNGTDPDELFVQGAAQNRAKMICMGCDVRTECLADALDNRVEFGVWGGMTERERRALLRRRPDVTSWQRLLTVARDEHQRVNGVEDYDSIPLLPAQQDNSSRGIYETDTAGL